MTEGDLRHAETSIDVGSDSVRYLTEETLAWARERDYAGWDPYDGLNSAFLSVVGRTVLTRLIGIHLVNKSPVNLRPVLGVPKERNPMGVALFARTLLYLYELDGDEQYLAEAESLLGWLREKRARSYRGTGWGYNFDWQNGRKFFLPAYEPCAVVSVLCGRAFEHHWRVTDDDTSLRIATDVAEFITNELNTVEVDGHTAYSYTRNDEFVVVNANALAASYLAKIGESTSDTNFGRRAAELVRFIVDCQTDDGAWYYAVPPDESHLTHDNFHTGYVVESLLDYLQTTDGAAAAERAYERGLSFYRDRLFEDDGAPRFEHDKPYPRDVHGAAQGIRTFVRDDRAAVRRDAQSIIEWTVDNLLDPDGYFYRNRGRYFDDETPYIRWSQAWMCFALSSYLYATAGDGRRLSVGP